MPFHDRAHDHQPHSQPLGLGGVEGLEQVPLHVRRQAGPGVVDGDLYLLVVLARAYRHRSRLERGGHRFERVEHQVEHHLLQLHRITDDGRGVRVERQGEVRLPMDGVAREHLHRLAADIVDVHLGGLRHLVPQEHAGAIDDLCRAHVLVHDVPEDLHCFLNVGGGSAEEQDAALGVGANGGKRLSQLVRDRGGELADHRDAPHVCHLPALLIGFSLGEPALRDVEMRDDRTAVLVLEAVDAYLVPLRGR